MREGWLPGDTSNTGPESVGDLISRSLYPTHQHQLGVVGGEATVPGG